MNKNIVLEYINYVNNSIYQFYKILLGSKYEKKLIKPFVDKYIDVRYYNNTLYEKEKNIVNRINKELTTIANVALEEYADKTEEIKNIYALFGYILYFDDCLEYESINRLINSLLEDKVIKLEYTNETKETFNTFIKEFIKKKDSFFTIFETSAFTMTEKRIKTKLYYATITQQCRISNLYSEFAINKAFNSGIVNEQKMFVLYTLVAVNILKLAVGLDFSRKYLLDFPISIVEKNKKQARLLSVLDNELVKSHVNLVITYEQYDNYKKEINELINNGYNIALIIDKSFNEDYEKLILFSYLLISDDLECYNDIINSKDKIQCPIITI